MHIESLVEFVCFLAFPLVLITAEQGSGILMPCGRIVSGLARST